MVDYSNDTNIDTDDNNDEIFHVDTYLSHVTAQKQPNHIKRNQIQNINGNTNNGRRNLYPY
jgi:hypothetical protein